MLDPSASDKVAGILVPWNGGNSGIRGCGGVYALRHYETREFVSVFSREWQALELQLK